MRMNIESNINNQPFFSILLTVYNCEKYVLEALTSINSQSFSYYEVIIIDDTSTDSTIDRVNDYISGKSNWILYINEKNYGVSKMSNKGFNLCKGKYIAIFDWDDIWYREKLFKQHEFIIKYNLDFCYFSYSFIDEESREYSRIYYIKTDINYSTLIKDNYIGCSTVALSSEIIKKHQMRHDVEHEDYQFWLEIVKDGYVAKGINEPLVKYRIHDGSRSYNKIKAAINRFKIYYKYQNLGMVRNIYLFFCYTINGVPKTLRILLSRKRKTNETN